MATKKEPAKEPAKKEPAKKAPAKKEPAKKAAQVDAQKEAERQAAEQAAAAQKQAAEQQAAAKKLAEDQQKEMKKQAVKGMCMGFLTGIISKIAGRLMNKNFKNSVMVFDYIGKGCIAQVRLKEIPQEYEAKSLREMDLHAEKKILVMLVEHKGKMAEPASANTVFRVGDKLTVFGIYNDICKTFHANEHFEEI